jgi:mannosylglycerate hydrolase
MAAPRTVHLVPHTHWDREWYEPFQRFRMRLVDLVDRVLDLAEADAGFAFTFDGQTAAIEDYLEVRPEAEPRVRRLAGRGQLGLGPWRILADEFLVSGETLVRNLESGWRRAEALGGVMPVGYLPDEFGHAAQMPQLLRRAGIGHAVLWRGVPAAIDHHGFTWVAPDGSAVRAEYLAGGYSNALPLLALPEGLAERVNAFDELMRPFFGDDEPLGMYGSDHSEPLPGLVGLVASVNQAQDRWRLRLETLGAYVAGLPDDADRRPRWQGELRSGARANLLMGVTSARVELKAACTHAERLLERYAEPLQALWGRSWPDRFLDLAWGKVIESSGHDSVTGCGADAVAQQVLVRLAEAEQIASALRDRAAAEVAAGVPAGAVAVLNPSPHPRSGLVELDLAVPAGWAAVALELPGGRRLPTQEIGGQATLVDSWRLPGEQLKGLLARRIRGRELFGRVVNGHTVEAPGPGTRRLRIVVGAQPDPAVADMDELRLEVAAAVAAAPDASWELRVEAAPRRRLLADVPVPALGWTTVRPVPAGAPAPTAARQGPAGAADGDEGPAAAASARAIPAGDVDGGEDPAAAISRRVPAGDPDDGMVRAGERRLGNGLVEVEVAAAGTLRISGGGVERAGAGRLVDGGDAGDLYNYGPPADDELVDAPVSVAVRLLEQGPLRGRLEVARAYRWPCGLRDDRAGRAAEPRAVATTTLVEVRAGEPFVRLTVTVDNRCSDHRLRLHLPLAAPADRSSAEGQFAVTERGRTAEGRPGEVPLPTFPARGFVDAGGVALLLDQVTEYELLDGELAVTVLRAVGQISRNANPYREEPAGPELATPGAQAQGERELRLAVLPHRGGWHEAGVLAAMERYQHDLVAAAGPATAAGPGKPTQAEPGKPADAGPGKPTLAERAGLEVQGDGVVLSSLRRRNGWLELRLACQQPAGATATVTGPFARARRADLLGRPGEDLPLDGGALRLPLGPWEIATVQLGEPPDAGPA